MSLRLMPLASLLLAGLLANGTAVAGLDTALAEGLAAMQQGRPAEAAGRWEALAQQRPADGDDAGPPPAALAWVLAAIARDKAGDDAAFADWGRAMAVYGERGGSWPDQRRQLARQLAEIRSRLTASSSEAADSLPALSREQALLLGLETATGISRYNGPRLGPAEAGSSNTADAPVVAASKPPLPVRQLPLAEPMPSLPSAGKPPAKGTKSTAIIAPASPAEGDAWLSASARVLADAMIAEQDGADAAQSARDLRDETDRSAAWAAWRYVGQQADAETGLCRSSADERRISLWQIGDCLAGLLSARELALVDAPGFAARIAPLLDSLEHLKLVDGLPARLYDSSSAEVLAPPTGRGARCSPDELARLLVWLKLLATWVPAQADAVDRIVGRWHLATAAAEIDGLPEGYARYARAALRLHGQQVPEATLRPVLQGDEGLRLPRSAGADSWFTSDPFVLQALEFGDRTPNELRLRAALYDAQRSRSQSLRRLVAAGELGLDRRPGFAMATLLSPGSSWQTLDGDGQPVASAVDFASGAAYGWAVLQGDGYADQLRARVLALDDPRLGLRSGEWRGGKPIEQVDLHTQAMVLEAVLYRSRGGQRLLADAAGSTP